VSDSQIDELRVVRGAVMPGQGSANVYIHKL
jgi:hypothetical protein